MSNSQRSDHSTSYANLRENRAPSKSLRKIASREEIKNDSLKSLKWGKDVQPFGNESENSFKKKQLTVITDLDINLKKGPKSSTLSKFRIFQKDNSLRTDFSPESSNKSQDSVVSESARKLKKRSSWGLSDTSKNSFKDNETTLNEHPGVKRDLDASDEVPDFQKALGVVMERSAIIEESNSTLSNPTPRIDKELVEIENESSKSYQDLQIPDVFESMHKTAKNPQIKILEEKGTEEQVQIQFSKTIKFKEDAQYLTVKPDMKKRMTSHVKSRDKLVEEPVVKPNTAIPKESLLEVPTEVKGISIVNMRTDFLNSPRNSNVAIIPFKDLRPITSPVKPKVEANMAHQDIRLPTPRPLRDPRYLKMISSKVAQADLKIPLPAQTHRVTSPFWRRTESGKVLCLDTPRQIAETFKQFQRYLSPKTKSVKTLEGINALAGDKISKVHRRVLSPKLFPHTSRCKTQLRKTRSKKKFKRDDLRQILSSKMNDNHPYLFNFKLPVPSILQPVSPPRKQSKEG